MVSILTLFNVFLVLSSPIKNNSSAKIDTLKIFNPSKIYMYEATFTDKNGKLVSKENIELQPLGKPWTFQKSQTSYKAVYHYTSKDSIAFLSYINPTTKNIKRPKRYIWYRSTVTGAIENDSVVWMHPFRDNQYEYTEVAPFPEVKKLL